MRNNLPLLQKYEKILRQDKTSMVFAPLAEIHRKAGNFKKAIGISRDGLSVHRDHISGRIVLATCYYEVEDYSAGIDTLRDYVDKNLENNSLQKIWGKLNLEIGNNELALKCFNRLLFLFPGDQELKDLIDNIELSISPNDIKIEDDEGKRIDLRQWEEKSLDQEQIEVNTNDKTSIGFARLFNRIGDKDAVDQILDQLESDGDDSLSNSIKTLMPVDKIEESKKGGTSSPSLMGYFDQKACEIDQVLGDNKSHLNDAPSGMYISNPDPDAIAEIKLKCNQFLNLLIKKREIALT